MKICIVTAIWQREALTKIFLKSVQRYWQDYGIGTAIAGSEGAKTRDMCLDAGAAYVEVPNQPLSRKFNSAITTAYHNYTPDGFIILGSDDFMNHDVIQRYQILLEQGVDIAGFKDCYYYDAKAKQGFFWGGWTVKHRQGESVGMGRLLSAKAFNALKGRPWSSATAGLDWIMTQRLKRHKHLKRRVMSVREGSYVIVDVKGFGSISSLGSYELEKVDTDVFNTIPEFSEIEKLC